MANNWQLLTNVKWAENDGEYIPLVGAAANALMIFNRHCGTSHIMTASFRKVFSGCRGFDGGWTKMPDGQMPADALSLTDGSSLIGLRRARSRVQARVANAALKSDAYAGCVDVSATAGEVGAAQQVRDGALEQKPSAHWRKFVLKSIRCQMVPSRDPVTTLGAARPPVSV